MSFIHHSHSESDQREALNVQRSSRLINAELLRDLESYKAEHKLTNRELGKRLGGYSESLMGRALAQISDVPSKTHFNGDVSKFEGAVRELFRHEEERRRAPLVALQSEGFMVSAMADFLDTLTHTGDIGIAYSPAGKGKTCGALVWHAHNKLAVMVTALKSRSGWRSIRDAIVAALPRGTSKRHGETTAAFIQRIFHNSKRLLIVDNAHLLTESARYWLAYDWHGETGCPVALLGNEIIVRQWGHREGEDANDQLSSRVGLAYEVRPDAEQTAEATARKTIALYYPQASGDAEAVKLVAEVVANKGSVRAAEKHLKLAADLAAAKAGLTPAKALRAANRKLLTRKFREAA